MIKLIKPSYTIIEEPDWSTVPERLERIMRTCYKSEDKITPGSADKLIRNIIARGHESTLEHIGFSVRFVIDTGVTHEAVRHRHCSFSQTSTRYVNYNGKAMEFILPPWLSDDLLGDWDYVTWLQRCPYKEDEEESIESMYLGTLLQASDSYSGLIKRGWRPEQARDVLPKSLASELIMTTNLRDWRHIFHLRCDRTAHPQMREIMIPLYEELKAKCPVVFDSVEFNT